MLSLKHLAILAGTLPLGALATTAAAYDAGSVSDGGTVSGKVTYSGSVPTKKVIPPKDADVCGSIRDVKLIVVGPGNGVGDAEGFLTEVASGKDWGAPEGVPEIDKVQGAFDLHRQELER